MNYSTLLASTDSQPTPAMQRQEAALWDATQAVYSAFTRYCMETGTEYHEKTLQRFIEGVMPRAAILHTRALQRAKVRAARQKPAPRPHLQLVKYEAVEGFGGNIA